jgi:hypothetical protein
LSFRCCLIPVEFDDSGIYTRMVPGMAFPGMGRNGIPVEFRSNSVSLFSLFICTNDVYLATKHSHSILPTHHQPCSSPPPAFVPAHDGLKTLPHRHQSPPLTSITHAHNYHHSKNNMAAPRHQVNERRPHQRDQHVGGSRRTTMMLSFVVLVYIINEGEYLVDLPQNGQEQNSTGIPLEFCSNSVCLFVTDSLFICDCLFVTDSLFICTNDVYLATKHGHSLLLTHHQPCTSPPTSIAHTHDYHRKNNMS